ncbi:MAG: hypothetical protein ACKOLA_01505 [Spartobacteria bacterium]
MSEPPVIKTLKNTAFSWAAVIIAVLLALPFGWGLVVCVAYLVAGKDFGQLPVLTVPLSLIASVLFALLPVINIKTCLAVLIVGIVAFLVISLLMAWIGHHSSNPQGSPKNATAVPAQFAPYVGTLFSSLMGPRFRRGYAVSWNVVRHAHIDPNRWSGRPTLLEGRGRRGNRRSRGLLLFAGSCGDARAYERADQFYRFASLCIFSKGGSN